MKQARVKITGVTPYSQGKYVQAEKLPKEGHDDYEKRTWRERLHRDKSGEVFIPAMSIKNCLYDAAKYLSIQIPGKGKATYTKHFEAGVMVMDSIPLGIKVEDVPGEWLHVPSDGRKGGDKRVLKCFPIIQEWGGEVVVYVLDETITKDVFMDHMKQAGQFIGLGRFRPRRGGFYGRFTAELLEWSDYRME